MPDQKYWNLKAAKLDGLKIVEARYLTAEEAESNFGWDRSGLVLFLSNGENIVFSRDDEGNGPGACFLSKDTLPVIDL
jgi:hypothetical protein